MDDRVSEKQSYGTKQNNSVLFFVKGKPLAPGQPVLTLYSGEVLNCMLPLLPQHSQLPHFQIEQLSFLPKLPSLTRLYPSPLAASWWRAGPVLLRDP